MWDQLDPKEILAQLARLVPPEPPELRGRPEASDLLVRLGLLELKAIPASKVRLVLQGQLAQREPLALRVRKALKAMQGLQGHKARQA